MENAVTIAGVLVIWWMLQAWILPMFGVPT
jgi:hypothetical protein